MSVRGTIWRWIRPAVRPVGAGMVTALFYLLRVFPVRKDKVVACVFSGKSYDDNQRFILEELHRMRPDADYVWVTDRRCRYGVPSWMRTVPWHSFRQIYEYATARIWTNNCLAADYFVKRKGQLYVETWHGGLGIKKVAEDVAGDSEVGRTVPHTLKKASAMADVFISNSDHLSVIYRRAFHYRGPIWKCGYPKNDMLVRNRPEEGGKARRELGIPQGGKLLLYAPTWRQRFQDEGMIDMRVYDLDLPRLKRVLAERFGGEWTLAVRFHPDLRPYAHSFRESHPDILDATDFPDMQRLLMAADVVVSDYSSCIFDAALRRIPCFTYATDFDRYKHEERGVYYEMEELPFPYACDNDGMERNVRAFDAEDYLRKWDAFCVRMGLIETGHAAHDIAEKMNDYLDGRAADWPDDEPKNVVQQ